MSPEELDLRCAQWRHHTRVVHYCVNPRCPSRDPVYVELRRSLRRLLGRAHG